MIVSGLTMRRKPNGQWPEEMPTLLTPATVTGGPQQVQRSTGYPYLGVHVGAWQ
jgi:hypothetical protein